MLSEKSVFPVESGTAALSTTRVTFQMHLKTLTDPVALKRASMCVESAGEMTSGSDIWAVIVMLGADVAGDTVVGAAIDGFTVVGFNVVGFSVGVAVAGFSVGLIVTGFGVGFSVIGLSVGIDDCGLVVVGESVVGIIVKI